MIIMTKIDRKLLEKFHMTFNRVISIEIIAHFDMIFEIKDRMGFFRTQIKTILYGAIDEN